MNDFAKDLLGEGIEDENKNHPGYTDIFGDDDNTPEPAFDPERMFQDGLKELLDEAGHSTLTFEEAGVMTRNAGLIVDTGEGKFQVTIVQI